MTEQFDRDVSRAVSAFTAAIRTAAQRAAILAVESAFARVPHPVSEIGGAVAKASDEPPRSVRSRARRVLTPDERLAVLGRAVTAIREHPGSTTAQLGQALGMPTASLRPYLQQLACNSTIRIEESRLSGLRRHAYFAVEHRDAGADRPLVPAEATA